MVARMSAATTNPRIFKAGLEVVILERSMIRVARTALLSLLACVTSLGPLAAETPTLIDAAPASSARIEPVAASHGMVVAQEARAARIGVAVLEQGGNAVDAAVATGFALAVSYPRAGNIGGGGYMLIHLAQRKIDTAIDYRETAPAAITRAIFLDERGEADPHKSQDSALAIGVPGTVAGLALAHAKYGSGKFTLAQLIAPAIALAREGIPIENDVADSLPRSQPRLAQWPSTAKIFLGPDGRVLAPGATLIQRDLADTLTAIARDGPRAFYRGVIADKLVAAIRAAGGIMTREDLERYQPIERTPTFGSYRGYRIISMPPSSSGGVVLIEMLNILEGYKLGELEAPARLHLMIEAMRRGYAVANTTTLNFSYGLGFVAEGTGVLLNNELDDFAAKPLAPNAAGLIGGEANAPGPRKRPLSSMTPTIVLKEGKPFIVTGSPGGSRIITTVLQVLVNVIDRKLPVAEAISEPRVHHQWWPDEVAVEQGFSPELIRALKARGHNVVDGLPRTSANSILVTPKEFVGAADNRTRGA